MTGAGEWPFRNRLLRILHWTRVAAFAAAWLSTQDLSCVHETLTTLMRLASLHVGGVVGAWLRQHENLARAGVAGGKRSPTPRESA